MPPPNLLDSYMTESGLITRNSVDFATVSFDWKMCYSLIFNAICFIHIRMFFLILDVI
jgi:hypothetical protein